MGRNGPWTRVGGGYCGPDNGATHHGGCGESRGSRTRATGRMAPWALVAWALLAGCASTERRLPPVAASADGNAVQIEAWTTTSDHRLRLSPSLLAFDSVDDQPVDLIFALFAPPNASSEHLRALARVSRMLRQSDVREHLRQARTPDAIHALLVQERPSAAA